MKFFICCLLYPFWCYLLYFSDLTIIQKSISVIILAIIYILKEISDIKKKLEEANGKSK